MDLLEYQGKQLFAKHGVPVPEGRPASTVVEAVEAAEELGYPVVIKAQVQIGGRGKAGGIKLATGREEAQQHADAILGMDIRGFTVHEVWVEQASEIDEEYYAAIVFDRSAKQPMAMLSRMGGMDVEAVAEEDPEAMRMLHVDPLLGFQPFHGRRLAFEAGIAADVIRPVGAMLAKLYDVFVAEDATLVEVNPLAKVGDGRVLCLDAKITLDENASFRHPDHEALVDQSAVDPLEQAAKAKNLNYVKLDGEVGIIGNGAGLVMSTLDVVAYAGERHGGVKPANFLDIGGGASAQVMANGLEIVLSDPAVRSVFVNVFGGITACDAVANGIVQAFELLASRDEHVDVPLVVRLDGNNAELGRKILSDAGLPGLEQVDTMDGAARRAAELAAS